MSANAWDSPVQGVPTSASLTFEHLPIAGRRTGRLALICNTQSDMVTSWAVKPIDTRSTINPYDHNYVMQYECRVRPCSKNVTN
jgi:hypothetical protein